MSLSATAICLIACHAGPADHFATFAEQLVDEGYEVQVYASGPALKKFQDRHIRIVMSFDPDNLSPTAEIELAAQIAQKCSKTSAVLTDVGHPFDIAIQRALAAQVPQVLRLAYYDNPESYVPGGYSSIAAEVMLVARRVLFANANLEQAALYQEPNKEIKFQDRMGLGYYPVAQAEKIAVKRAEKHEMWRSELLSKLDIKDKGQKVLVYFGGNNDEYFTKAFPAFLSFLSEGASYTDLSNIVIVLQQHPGAKSKNIDRLQIDAWIKEQGNRATVPKMIVSDATTEDMQVIADGALFYQTSMGPLFALAGIPIVQVGHNTFEDILVKSHLCSSATTSSEFVKAVNAIKPEILSVQQRKTIFKSLGIKEDWFEIFKRALIN